MRALRRTTAAAGVTALALCLAAALAALPSPAAAVHWYLDYGRQECVSAWVPQDQWDLIMGSVAASGDLQATDVKTAEMDVQLETGILVYTPKRLQDPTAALDLTLKDPNGNVVYSQFHTNEDEASTPAHGRRGPWQLCMTISRTGKWYKVLLAQITHFNVNHQQLMGTHLEAPKTTMPNISAAPGPNITTVAPATDVARQTHVTELRLALKDMTMYLKGAAYEIRHRMNIVELHLRAAKQQAAHLLRWMAAINLAVISVCIFQVLAIRFMFRHGAKDPLNITTNGLGVVNSLYPVHRRRPLHHDAQHRSGSWNE